MMYSKQQVAEARSRSIVEYLDKVGVSLERRGGRYKCRSPFSEDRNPSFYVYPENAFYDFSNGFGGDVISLVMAIEEVSFTTAVDRLLSMDDIQIIDVSKIIKAPPRGFDIYQYLLDEEEDRGAVIEYANRRMFAHGSYVPTKYLWWDDEVGAWAKRLGCGFIHQGDFGEICGVKIRSIDNVEPRFNNRGASKFYVLENVFGTMEPVVYIVESETSASSLFGYLQKQNKNCVVVSYGGVNIPKGGMQALPQKWAHLSDRRLIIDYDGDEIIYQRRLKSYAFTMARPIKLELPKGEDLNTLICGSEAENISRGRRGDVSAYIE
jgi:hypothetical protein